MLDDLKHIKHPIPDWLHESLSIPRSSHRVDSDRCPIHYLSWGAENHPALIFLHGRMSHARCWAFIAPALADTYHCVALDLSGMGDSGHRDYYAYGVRAREVLTVTDMAVRNGAAHKPLLVTHSYGAVVALNACRLAPDRFAGLIACDPSIHHPDAWATQEPRVDGPSLRRPHRVYETLDAIVERFAFAPPQPCQHAVLKEYIAVHSAKQAASGWQWKFDPWVYSPKEEGHNDWWVTHTRDLVDTPLPKAIIYGERSEFTGADTVAAVSRCTDTIVGTVGIPEAHHHLMVDQPAAFTAAIRTMAKTIGAGSS